MTDIPEARSPSESRSLFASLAGLSLRWQISAFTCLAVLISLFAMGWVAFSQSATILTAMTLDQMATESRAAAGKIELTLQETRIDALQTPQFPPVPGIIRCMDANGTDPEQKGSTTEDWVQRLKTIVTAQMRQHREWLWWIPTGRNS